MTNKSHYKKFGIIQISVEALLQTQIHPNSTLSQIQTKGSQISNTNCVQTKERATNQIQTLQRTKREQITKPQNQNQVATNLSHYSKLQPTNIKEPQQKRASFSHTLTHLFL